MGYAAMFTFFRAVFFGFGQHSVKTSKLAIYEKRNFYQTLTLFIKKMLQLFKAIRL
jgi:hypothetical protein